MIIFEKGNNVNWPYVDTQKGNNVDDLLRTFPGPWRSVEREGESLCWELRPPKKGLTKKI